MNASPLYQGFGRRVTISGVLRCQTALRIGAGKSSLADDVVDLPVLRDAHNRPLLPGSSLKGAVRAQVEAILRTVATDLKLDVERWACDPIGQNPCCEDEDTRARRESATQKERTPAAQRAQEKRTYIEQHICHACHIFGAQGLLSHVLFSDSLVQDGALPEPRHGVSLDRDLARAASKRKFEFEVMPIGSQFPLRIELQGLPPALEGAVVAALELLGDGYLRLGGFKSRGMGQVSLIDPKVRLLTLVKGKPTPDESQSWAVYREATLAAFAKLCETGEVAHA